MTMCMCHLLTLYVCLLLCTSSVHTTWMYLGVASSGLSTSTPACSLVPGLVYQQLQVCLDNPHAMPCVSLGARLGLHECHYQFKYERWNCTVTHRNQSIFDVVIQQGTRETAFIYAATSAGVAHAVTSACSAGNLTDCTCDLSHEGQTAPEGWKWGGCSDNVHYGLWFAETFVDAPDKLRQAANGDVRSLMNLHNNEVGRKMLSSMMTLKCRCHGISGSCAVKTCWRSMPGFREIGDALKKKHESSVEISVPRATGGSGGIGVNSSLRRREKRKRREPIPETELVYVDRSPNYCRQDPERGITGTRGRECRRGSHGPDSCESLCCGRGFHTQEVRQVERCQCRFVWCCEVKCKTCETVTNRYTCK